MGFRFPLAAVLRLREINEEREERLLAQILAQVTQTRDEIGETDAQIAAALRDREAQLSRRMSVAELHAAYGLSQLLKERRQALVEQLKQFEKLRDEQIRKYRSAHQGRELLSTMRSRQKEAFMAERARKEQTTLDDIFISRRSRQ